MIQSQVSERFIHGCWRMNEWSYSTNQLHHFLHQVHELGINTFDHADIYGDYGCEDIFGSWLLQHPNLRQSIKLTSKCGIKYPCSKFPHYQHIYDTSAAHIIQSAERSLQNLHTDYLDLLLIHRPDPLFNAAEVAEAFSQLKQSGKVLEFGVSNFYPTQFALLQEYLPFSLVTNQIEVSVLQHEHFDNGNLDFLQTKKIRPQVWSPLAGGRLLQPSNPREQLVLEELQRIALEHHTTPEVIALAWLLRQPAIGQIILGSGKLTRITQQLAALEVNLSREEWFKLWTTARGQDIA